MVIRQPEYSPKQIARAIGASESSVKRWCDRGLVRTIRTGGGHRKIPLDGLGMLLRNTGRQLVDPLILGLPKQQTWRLCQDRGIAIGDQGGPEQPDFRGALANGDEDTCRDVLKSKISQGMSRSEAAELLITDAMRCIGEAWQRDDLHVYQERRGCDITMRLINEMRAELPPPSDGASIAIGGTLECDPYQLPTALVELTLREAGWNAVSLGSNLPVESFWQAANDYNPKMVWLSVSSIGEDAEAFVAEQTKLADRLGDDVSLLIGGQALTDDLRPMLSYSVFCDSLKHLAEFAATSL